LRATQVAPAPAASSAVPAAAPVAPPDPSPAPAAGPQAAPAPSSDDVANAINRLKGLLDSGAITQAEFDAKKAELLARL
jgi:hypothetical protein